MIASKVLFGLAMLASACLLDAYRLGTPTSETTVSASPTTAVPATSDDNEYVFQRAIRPALSERVCCKSKPYNVTKLQSYVKAVEVPYPVRHRYLFYNGCVFDEEEWCKEYRWKNYTNYRLETRTFYRTVVKEIFCKQGDEVCCEGYIKTESGCRSKDEEEKVKDLKNQIEDVFGRLLNRKN